MTWITEAELERLVGGIVADRDVIVRNNPIGTPEEILLWMLLGCLVSYLDLAEMETPCFSGVPTAETYREAIEFVIKIRRSGDFEAAPYLDRFRDAD
jgi:hypothetical protein